MNGIIAEIPYWKLEYLPKRPFTACFYEKDTSKRYAIDLEKPELGKIPVYPYQKDIFYKIYRKLESFVRENGRAPLKGEFTRLANTITSRPLAIEIIERGTGKFWKMQLQHREGFPYTSGKLYYPLPLINV